jgi:hypothetical protein
MEKYELELRFKELALIAYNKNNPSPVSATSPYFQAYLDAMVWGMVPRTELESWVEYYERKVSE